MEKQPHQEYRDDLAGKLKEIRNSDTENPETSKTKAQGYLDAKEETDEYQSSREQHLVDSERHRESILPADGRADILLDKYYPDLNREELVEALKAADDLYEAGEIADSYLMGSVMYDDPLFDSEYSKILDIDEESLGSKDEYDWPAMYNEIKSLRDAIKKIDRAPFMSPYHLTHFDRVFQGSSGRDAVGILMPTIYEIHNNYGKKEENNRIKNRINFLNKYRKNPEQVLRERQEILSKKQTEETERQKKIKEDEMNSFDPQI